MWHGDVVASSSVQRKTHLSCCLGFLACCLISETPIWVGIQWILRELFSLRKISRIRARRKWHGPDCGLLDDLIAAWLSANNLTGRLGQSFWRSIAISSAKMIPISSPLYDRPCIPDQYQRIFGVSRLNPNWSQLLQDVCLCLIHLCKDSGLDFQLGAVHGL